MVSDTPRTGRRHRKQRKTTVAAIHFFLIGVTQSILVLWTTSTKTVKVKTYIVGIFEIS